MAAYQTCVFRPKTTSPVMTVPSPGIQNIVQLTQSPWSGPRSMTGSEGFPGSTKKVQGYGSGNLGLAKISSPYHAPIKAFFFSMSFLISEQVCGVA